MKLLGKNNCQKGIGLLHACLCVTKLLNCMIDHYFLVINPLSGYLVGRQFNFGEYKVVDFLTD